jgi:hypothetical protein
MWKAAWLKPLSSAARALHEETSFERIAPHAPNDASKQKYVCQFTELARASSPMSPWDIRQDLRPLLAGNVTLAGFAVVVLTQLFNAAQRWRRGVSAKGAD